MKSSIRKFLLISAVAGILLVALAVRWTRTEAPTLADPAPAPQTARVPTLVELGSKSCKSCRAMIPVLDELRRAHPTTLRVRFIDVWKDPRASETFRVRIIPTQVLLDPDGRELQRHTGFWSATAIRSAFAALGYRLGPSEGATP